MKEPKLFQSRVCFDDYYENPKPYLIYDCWLDANCNGWNGWACPYMEKYEYLRYVNRCIRDYFENPEADDGCEGSFIDYIMAIEPQEIDGKILYYFGGWLCWNIEDVNFAEKRKILLEASAL